MGSFFSFRLLDILDVLIVAAVFYKIIILIRGTRAVQLIQGLAVLVFASALSKVLGLYTVSWLLRNTITVVLVALPVVFQPELRRTLEQLGRTKFIGETFLNKEEEISNQLILEEIVKAVMSLSRQKIGALIVLQRKTGLQDYIETGTLINGIITRQLLETLFFPNCPLHDGAVVIQGEKIAAAGCFLPLTENNKLDKQLGTRHRAGIGVTEETDALVIIVSEETGTVSLAEDGGLQRFINENQLRNKLQPLYDVKKNNPLSFSWLKWKDDKNE